jgi:hypothetical protein
MATASQVADKRSRSPLEVKALHQNGVLGAKTTAREGNTLVAASVTVTGGVSATGTVAGVEVRRAAKADAECNRAPVKAAVARAVSERGR